MKRLFYIVLAILFPQMTSAHVLYIAEEDKVSELSGSNFGFLLSVFTDTQNLILMGLTVLLAPLAYFLFRKWRWGMKREQEVEERMSSYKDLVPWMIRLSLGILLIGSGASGTLLSPALGGYEFLADIQILLGFLFIVGFLIEPAIVVLIVLFIYGLFSDIYLIGALEIPALAAVLLLVNGKRPGVDDLLNIPDIINFKRFEPYIGLILRVGIGVTMMYLALYEKIFNPALASYVVDVTLLNEAIPVSNAMWVFSAGVIEFLIGFTLFVGIKIRLVATITFLTLSVSFFYFNEEVYSHITLFTTLVIIFIYGKSKWCFENCVRIFK